ncbi:hypothetical protein NDU88_007005 [Pleurodeles waltl]|uniref:Uncharacterized protein n=1 Tax=Pleurodeles waltl TaxID=8319 RepID=A0AAV7VP82_PLEWA|nr:hypothetical protein NDU88_007005 [Pleurodeles waltl]
MFDVALTLPENGCRAIHSTAAVSTGYFTPPLQYVESSMHPGGWGRPKVNKSRRGHSRLSGINPMSLHCWRNPELRFVIYRVGPTPWRVPQRQYTGNDAWFPLTPDPAQLLFQGTPHSDEHC